MTDGGEPTGGGGGQNADGSGGGGRRRRRRRGGGGGGSPRQDQNQTPGSRQPPPGASAGNAAAGTPYVEPDDAGPSDDEQDPSRDPSRDAEDEAADDPSRDPAQEPTPQQSRSPQGRDQRGPRDRPGRDQRPRDQQGRDQRGAPGHEQRPRDQQGRDQRGPQPREQRPRDPQNRDQRPRDQPPRDQPAPRPEVASPKPSDAAREDAYADEPPPEAVEAWGQEDDSPPPAVALAADLPTEPPADDPDPASFPLVDGPGATLGDDVASVVSIKLTPAGRLQWCDAGEADYAIGERVIVDSERGPRIAWIAGPALRRAVRDRGLRRVIRRANDQDLRAEREDSEGASTRALRIAKDKAAALKLPLKVFRVEARGGKLNVYYTTDEQRLDVREFVQSVALATSTRVELRQIGARDEAKQVGGIGSCGLTLCCTTWLPEFVPVSIKMAKDQGLVLSPTKVAGQCGRLKCCLVYEQAGYAEMRKGLPKLGKRVISARGEGRVVEVDVLRQRVRVSYGMGDSEVLPAVEVKPMFPAANAPGAPREPDPPDADDDPSDPSLPSS